MSSKLSCKRCCGLMDENPEVIAKSTVTEIAYAIRDHTTSLWLNIILETVMMLLWYLSCMILPFNLYNGVSHGMTRSGYWLWIDRLVIIPAVACTRFAWTLYRDDQKREAFMEVSAFNIRSLLDVYRASMIVKIVAYVVLLCLTIVELGERTSTYAISYTWHGGLFCTGLGLLVVINVWQIIRVSLYKNFLEEAYQAGKLFMAMSPKEKISTFKNPQKTATALDINSLHSRYNK